MCTNNHLIYTKHHKPLVVPCGKCEACRQAKANRYSSLIKSECVGDGVHETLFVTLTYSNRYVPYIKKSEILANIPLGADDDLHPNNVNIYRHNSVRSVRVGFGKYAPKLYISDKIGEAYFPSLSERYVKALRGYKTVHYSSHGKIERFHDDKVSVLWFPDIQNFFKRLKINYERDFGKRLEMSYFYTGEIGPDTQRPHFHALIRIKKEDESNVRFSIYKSWKFHDWQLLERSSGGKLIQIAVDCSKYVASYVNSSAYLPKAFYGSPCVPKCHHSKFYGFSRDAFSLSQVLEAYDRRDLHYNMSFNVHGQFYEYRFLLPSYVIKHWFPKFKGFSQLPFDVLHDIYKDPYKLLQYARKLGFDSHLDGVLFSDYFRKFDLLSGSKLDVDYSLIFRDKIKKYSQHCDLVLNVRLLLHARQRFVEDYALFNDGDIGTDIFEKYAQIASDIWTIYSSNALKDSYENIPLEDWLQYSFYDGISKNINDSNYNMLHHSYLIDKYNKLDKSKRLNNKLSSTQSINY